MVGTNVDPTPINRLFKQEGGAQGHPETLLREKTRARLVAEAALRQWQQLLRAEAAQGAEQQLLRAPKEVQPPAEPLQRWTLFGFGLQGKLRGTPVGGGVWLTKGALFRPKTRDLRVRQRL